MILKEVKNILACFNEERTRMSWNHLDHLKQAGTTWNQLRSPGTRWNQQQTDTKHTKFIWRCCTCIIISQQNATLQIVFVIKGSILDVGKASQIRLCFAYILN